MRWMLLRIFEIAILFNMVAIFAEIAWISGTGVSPRVSGVSVTVVRVPITIAGFSIPR